MTTLFGWMSSDAQKSEDCYKKQITNFDTKITIDKPSAHAGYILTKSTHRACDLIEKNLISVAVTGMISWNNDQLEKHAKEHGYASSLFHAYKTYQEKLFDHITGHFSFAIIDNNNKSALIAIDRIGTNALAYTINNNGDFVFASDIETLRSYPGVERAINEQSIFDYLYFHVIPSPNTIYKNIFKIEPAQYISFKNGSISKRFYWIPEFNNSHITLDDSLKNKLLENLTLAVKTCQPTSQTGAFLSGGLDSSTISGVLARINGPDKATNTFSIGFDQHGYDEIEYARIASKKYQTTQHEYYVTPEDVRDAVVNIAKAYDEPYGNSSAIPALFCARLAKENGMDTLLAGDGGDEIFAGNARYAKQKILNIYDHIPNLLKSSVLEPLFLNTQPGNLPIVEKIKSYIEQARIPMPKRMESYNFLNRTIITDMLDSDYYNSIDIGNPDEQLRRAYDRCNSDNIIDKMLYLDWKITLADNDLRKVNTMCEMAGIDVKYPMLDDTLVDFSNTIPANLKLKGQTLRYYYKQALSGFLPDKIINKPKQGFGLPFGEWLKKSDGLQDIIYFSLDNFSKRNIIKPEFIKNIVSMHKSGHAAYYGTMVWVIALLELWLSEHDINI